ncbi:transposable element Tcb2 transposase [Trichonephila clavipes]|nr:transposable element Tcb2 transposase [Trichonephila clavipes]
MARRNHLDDFTRGRMIGKLEEGRTVTSVAAEFGINKSVVSRAWKAFQTTGTAVRKIGSGRPRTTTAGDNRYIILQAKRGRRQSASVIAQQHISSPLNYFDLNPHSFESVLRGSLIPCQLYSFFTSFCGSSFILLIFQQMASHYGHFLCQRLLFSIAVQRHSRHHYTIQQCLSFPFI